MQCMQSQDVAKYKLPETPGVYFFLGARKEVLYVGRATLLRDRVRSYFAQDIADTRGPKIVKMLAEAKYLEWRTTDSVLEAMLLEGHLIRNLKPPYNTDDKDDKSFNCVVITAEPFPRLLVARERDIDGLFLRSDKKNTDVRTKLQVVYGPFPEGGKLAVALKLIRKIFPYRDRCTPPESGKVGKPCFNRQIGLCPGVCTGEISALEYRKTIRHIRALFEGKKKTVISSLNREMRAHAQAQEFEKAAAVRRTLFALEHIADVALIAPDKKFTDAFRVEALDVAHTAGQETVGVSVSVVGGRPEKSLYRSFIIRKAIAGDDVGALRELMARRFSHPEWGIPDILVVDGGEAQLAAARALISERSIVTQVLSVVKDERHQPREILGERKVAEKHKDSILLANREAHRFAISFHRKRRHKKMFN